MGVPQTTPQSEQSEDHLAAELANHGLRATRQRMAILRLLRQSITHPTAIALHRHVLQEHPNISWKTVYEVLDSSAASSHLNSASLESVDNKE